MVRSLDEVKEELRSLTVKVDGQEETVSGLLQTGRSFFYQTWRAYNYRTYWKVILFLIMEDLVWRGHRTNHSLTTSLQTFHGRLFFPCHTSLGAWKGLLCSTGKATGTFHATRMLLNPLPKVLLGKTSAGDLELLAILLSSPHSTTHLVTQVLCPNAFQVLFKLQKVKFPP